MFFYIKFCDIASKEIVQLMFELAGYPNKTILSYCKFIKVPTLLDNEWIIWIDQDKIDKNFEEFLRFTKMNGIDSFIKLDMQKSIYDKDWLWNDNYLGKIFKDFRNIL
jgi:hypothetical protein